MGGCNTGTCAHRGTASTSIAEASSSIVISQVYGGGANSGAMFRNDFVELFNRSSASVSIEGWTIQYASSTGSSWDRTRLTGSIQPGQYFLVALSGSTGGTFVSELFPSVTNFEGMLELTSSSSIVALALRQNFASGIFSTLPVSPTSTEAYFSPNAGTSSGIVQEIQRTQNTIDIAIYSFTRDEIADALIAAKNRGVTIRILADSSQADGTGSDISRLEAAGFQLKRTNGGGGGILHDKYAVFDGRMLVTGSYNWSTNAEENNDENAVFIRDRAVIAAFQTNFNAMWSSR